MLSTPPQQPPLPLPIQYPSVIRFKSSSHDWLSSIRLPALIFWYLWCSFFCLFVCFPFGKIFVSIAPSCVTCRYCERAVGVCGDCRSCGLAKPCIYNFMCETIWNNIKWSHQRNILGESYWKFCNDFLESKVEKYVISRLYWSCTYAHTGNTKWTEWPSKKK